MEKEIKTGKIPVMLWTTEVEPGAMDQIRNLSNFPFAFHHVAIMPDCHQGYGMPIGGVMATRGVIVPNAVGVDIGCGMSAAATSLTHIEMPVLKEIMSAVRRHIPLGFKHHEKPRPKELMPDPGGKGDWKKDMPVVAREYRNALYQLGTLGGGNHFIEFQKGSDGRIWVMVHSGSRNIGKQVADHYNRLAITLNEKWKSPVPKSWQLACLPEDHKEGQKYIREMNYCIAFAFASRRLMVETILGIMKDIFGRDFSHDPLINIAHNFASLEEHFGERVWVHRKGATQARRGQTGIVPGSQGSVSYIVEGLGNPSSFESCSHGAGRVMGRREAMRKLDLDTVKKEMDSRNIIHSIRSRRDLDEAPHAYKDIRQVMEEQSDLVKIRTELQPLAVIKG
ncbi:MAG TPA: RtcB family protein [Bacteroidetes bacterium]|nr:RtcB family protein [Bacteroidota bacterium]